MRAIKVTYRAIFQQPTGALNPMGCKLAGPFPVELFQRGPHWFAREIASPRRQVYARIGKDESLTEMKRHVEQCFESQSEAWQIWGDPLTPTEKLDQRPPGGQSWERLLTPYDILDIGKGKFAAYEPEDRTHIMNGKTLGNERIPPAACGLKLPAKCFISNLANVEPTCKGCAEVWRMEYQNR